MSYQPYYISAFEGETGLNTYYEPFLIPEKAFTKLEDAYCFRGRVLRRSGFTLLGRLRRLLTIKSIGNISAAGAGTVVVNIFTGLGIAATEPNAQIQPGTATNPISIIIGAPISQTLTDATGNGTMTIAPGGLITAANINYNTGDLTLLFSGIAGASAATFTGAYYPGLPVMGLRLQELSAINQEDMIAFDQKYAYKFDVTLNQFVELIIGTTWNGSDSDFFWTTNYSFPGTAAIFWATNSNATGATADPIRTFSGGAWATFAPKVNAAGTIFLEQAEIILPYKSRLLFLNTYEGATLAGATHYHQRVRWSWFGDPTNADAFDSVTPGRGGYVDLPTNEVVVSAEYIKDTLLIKCERSSWKLFYTGNETAPFDYQKINTELGSESKFSLVPFDKGVFSIANYGITTDDSVNVERIDVVIPNIVFNFQNTHEGVIRAQGIRDYTNEIVYWNFPNAGNDIIYPNKMLVYNYRNNTYAIFNDSYTCFGYFQRQNNLPWNKLTDITWASWNNPWNYAIDQAGYPNIVGGNQHGFVEILDQQTVNDTYLYLQSMTFGATEITFTIPNHNLQNNDVIKLTGIVGDKGVGLYSPALLNNHTFLVSRVDANNVKLTVYVTTPTKSFADIYTENLASISSLYYGAGLVTKINNIGITTKVFTPFYEDASKARLGYVDYFFDKTQTGELTINVFADENKTTSLNDPSTNPSLMGTNVVLTRPENTTLIPFQTNQEKIWHRQFIQTIVQNFQIDISMTLLQLADESISSQDITLHALAFYLSKNARLVQ